jgi:hypothetical protein
MTRWRKAPYAIAIPSNVAVPLRVGLGTSKRKVRSKASAEAAPAQGPACGSDTVVPYRNLPCLVRQSANPCCLPPVVMSNVPCCHQSSANPCS